MPLTHAWNWHEPHPTGTVQQAMREWTVTGPLPLRELSPNWSGHWAKKHSATKGYRAVWWAIYKQAQIPRLDRIAVRIEFYTAMSPLRDAYRPFDISNALQSFQPGLNALQDAGVIATDSRKRLASIETVIYGTMKEHNGEAKVVVTIRETLK